MRGGPGGMGFGGMRNSSGNEQSITSSGEQSGISDDVPQVSENFPQMPGGFPQMPNGFPMDRSGFSVQSTDAASDTNVWTLLGASCAALLLGLLIACKYKFN